MRKYIFKRLLQLIPILIIVSILIFFMVRLSSIDPISVIIGDKRSTPEIIAQIKEKYNFNKPLIVQYFIWIRDLLHGNLGLDYKNKQEIASLIIDRLPVTAGLVLFSSLISIVVAIPVGILTAIKKNTYIDKILSIITLILVSSPGFLTSVFLIIVVSTISPEFAFTGTFNTLGEYLQRMLFPSLALSFGMIALISRVTRSSMIEQHQTEYSMVATAKGLNESTVVLKHCLKNAIIPVITIFGVLLGSLISGTVLVENVFSLAGIGSLLINGINEGNFPLVQDITLMLVTVFLLLSLFVDVLYAIIDPRLRLK